MYSRETRKWKHLKQVTPAVLLITICIFVLGAPEAKAKLEIRDGSTVRLGSLFTIQEAINAANPGEVVYVPNGIYFENVVLNKSVTLVGESPGNTIIDGGGRSGVLIQVTADNVSVSGFTIRNGTFGVSMVNSRFGNINGNSMEGDTQGIYLQNSDNNLVTANNLTNDASAITIQQSNGNSILANSLMNNYNPGISIYDSHSNTVSRNFIENNPAYGIYLENCQNTTISDNSVTLVCTGIHLQSSQNNTISGNTVTKTGPLAINLDHSDENTVERNDLRKNELTIQLFYSFNNVVIENNVTMNMLGLFLGMSGNNTLEENYMTGNSYGFGVYGEQLSDFVNSVGVSNVVDGKPVYYWLDHHGGEVPSDAGFVALINSTGIGLANLKLENNYEGILLAYSNHITLRNLTVSNSLIGIWLLNSSSNAITECTLQGNTQTVWLKRSNNNTIYWNNFMSPNPFDASGTVNTWDNGYPDGGNYWAAFAGTDESNGPYQNATGSDGISDSGYALNPGNKDHFPLMSPIKVLDAGEWDGQRYSAYVISNYTVSDFTFDPSEKAVSFNLTGPEGANGFCRIVIPTQLLWAEDERWTIMLGEGNMNYTQTSNQDYTFLYLTFLAKSGTVKIQGTHAIPEFNDFAIVLFLIFASTVTAFAAKRLFKRFVPAKAKIGPIDH